jgi:hypothetical protein
MRGFAFTAVLACVACAFSAPPPATVQANDPERSRSAASATPPEPPRTDGSVPEEPTPEQSTPEASRPTSPASAPAALATSTPPPSPPAETVAPSPTAQEVRQCSARGGTIQPVCLSGHLTCVVPYRDGGKRCRDKRDCTGDCLYEGSEPAPATAVGSCQRTNDPCGCKARIKQGTVQSVVCVD